MLEKKIQALVKECGLDIWWNKPSKAYFIDQNQNGFINKLEKILAEHTDYTAETCYEKAMIIDSVIIAFVSGLNSLNFNKYVRCFNCNEMNTCENDCFKDSGNCHKMMVHLILYQLR